MASAAGLLIEKICWKANDKNDLAERDLSLMTLRENDLDFVRLTTENGKINGMQRSASDAT